MKTNIVPIQNALQKIEDINGYTFTWKNTGKRDVGVIAQEIEEILPELVHTNTETGLKSVQYPNLVALVIEAMKELNQRADELSAEYAGNESVLQLVQKYDQNQAVLADLEQRVTQLEDSM